MEKECCTIKVTELDEGYRFEVTGPEVKDRCGCIPIIHSACCTGTGKGEEKGKC